MPPWIHNPTCGCAACGNYGQTVRETNGPAPLVAAYTAEGSHGFRWHYYEEDYGRPTTCPICGVSVFFVRHNESSAWLDSLSKPWPKHTCFDHDRPRYGHHQSANDTTFVSQFRISRAAVGITDPLLGVVIEVLLCAENSLDIGLLSDVLTVGCLRHILAPT